MKSVSRMTSTLEKATYSRRQSMINVCAEETSIALGWATMCPCRDPFFRLYLSFKTLSTFEYFQIPDERHMGDNVVMT